MATNKRKRKILSVLSKPELLEIAAAFDLKVTATMKVSELVEVLARSKRATPDALLPKFPRERLRELCELLGLPVSASNKAELVERILGRGPEQAVLLLTKPDLVEAEPVAPPVRASGELRPPMAITEPAPPTSEHPGVPTEPIDPLSEPTLTRPVPPRQPRLVWHGWDIQELTTAVPTQVVEIVRPMLVKERPGEFSGFDATGRKDKGEAELNRLIWTNDNIVALKTLLDERDTDGGYRYRGKVDLVYIDPPFMVQSDFLAQNSIDIKLDEEESVLVKKEPSLVEILAYRDTWRQGLDSFLSMLRARLVLLKDLLSSTGRIYVHLDWHAVHYVKVMMDEIFGYELFQNEIIWQRYGAHNDAGQGSHHFGRIHDTILAYGTPNGTWAQIFTPLREEYVQSTYRNIDPDGRRFRTTPLTGPGGAEKGNPVFEWNGYTRAWRYSREKMQRLHDEGRLHYSSTGYVSQKLYLDESDGIPVQDIWTDIGSLAGVSSERLGYPTQKPVSLVERIIAACTKPGDLILDCFAGSGTTLEAAERQGRRWIGIDNAKYAIHLGRKRLIQLHGTSRPPEKVRTDYVECPECNIVRRKDRPVRSRSTHEVRPFTIENMGVYQRAAEWQDFQTRKSLYRDEMIKVFGGTPIGGYRLLHGHKDDSWIHVGPLDGPVSSHQVSEIVREAHRYERRHITVLSADFDTISEDEHRRIARQFDGMRVTIRVIPAAAIDEIRRRIEYQRTNPIGSYSSTTIPAFYAPLAIVLKPEPPKGRLVSVHLERCEIDSESFLASQRPTIPTISEGMSEARRKKAKAEQERWAKRRKQLEEWLGNARSWRAFVDFWAIDWNYGERTGPDGKPIFETDWQSFRQKKVKGSSGDELAFVAERQYEEPGRYRIAARVTDVFGNDGIAVVEVDID